MTVRIKTKLKIKADKYLKFEKKWCNLNESNKIINIGIEVKAEKS